MASSSAAAPPPAADQAPASPDFDVPEVDIEAESVEVDGPNYLDDRMC